MMRIRPDPARWTGAPFGVLPDGWLRALAAMVVLLVLAAGPAAAQQQTAATSTIAGVTFPTPARIWFPDPERTQTATLNDMANRLDRSCAGMEFQVWDVAGDAAAEQLRTATDVAFGQAGWTLELVPTPEGVRGYLARRGPETLILAWLRPLSDQLGLALCIVEVAGAPLDEGAGGAIRIAEITAEDGTPLPRPRPDPNAIPVDAPPASLVVGAIPTEPIAPALPGVNETIPPPGPVVAQAADPPPPVQAPALSPDPLETTSGGGDGPSIWLLLLSAALAGGAFVLVRWGLGSMRDRSVARWPTTIATVVYSQVASEDRPDRNGRNLVRYVPVVAYEYAI